MNCPTCGTENREGARFCRHCGAGLSESFEPQVPSAAETTENAPQEPVPTSEETEDPPEEPLPTVDDTKVPEPEEEQVADKEVSAEETAPDVTADEGFLEESQPEPEQEEVGTEEPVLKAGAVESPDEDISVSESTAAEAEEELAAAPPDAQEFQSPSPLLWGEDLDDEPLPELEDSDFSFWREEEEPLVAVEPGTVLDDRYVVVEVLDEQQHEVLYHAQDLRQCWQCGFEDNAVADTFCKMCGAALERKLDVRLLEVRDSKTHPSNGEAVVARLADGDRHFVLLTKSEFESLSGPTPQSTRLIVGQRSDPGQVRGLNEDSLLSMMLSPTYEGRTGPVLGLFAVADGMGGHAGGEVASKLALQVLFERVMHSIVLSEMSECLLLEGDIVAHMRQATLAANDAVYLARQKGESDMGTTLTAAFIRNDQVFLAHVGDCRVYRWNADGLEQLTTDHSVVASMIASGQAAPEEIYTHPHRSIVYRCIGDKPMVEVDADALPLASEDRLILCSDGLWEAIRDEGITDVLMQESDPQSACDLLVHHANVAGGEDNISVIIIQIEPV